MNVGERYTSHEQGSTFPPLCVEAYPRFPPPTLGGTADQTLLESLFRRRGGGLTNVQYPYTHLLGERTLAAELLGAWA
jgi:hypothetical protein